MSKDLIPQSPPYRRVQENRTSIVGRFLVCTMQEMMEHPELLEAFIPLLKSF